MSDQTHLRKPLALHVVNLFATGLQTLSQFAAFSAGVSMVDFGHLFCAASHPLYKFQMHTRL